MKKKQKNLKENYIVGEGLILIPAIYIIGMIIRKTDKIPNKYIPIILLPLGILGAMGIMGFTVKAAIQGILITGAAVYGDQVYKQMTKKEEPKKEE